MIAIENVNTYVTGVFPDAVADNSTGAATQDGFEFIAEFINNTSIGPQQAFMDRAGLTPDGVTESATASQMVDAMKKGFAVGPGWVQRRDINATPAVNGDRSLILADQGVLISAYTELDAAVWITGNTAAQVAAIAAGTPYYRSSDAAGLVGDAAGPYLQLPGNPSPMGLKQYSEAGGDFTITGTGLTTTRAIAVPYQTTDGTWRLIFNIKCARTANVQTAQTASFSGVTFKNVGSYQQAIAGYQLSLATLFQAWSYVTPNTSTLNWAHASGSINDYMASGDVELESKPTWADAFEPAYAITY